MGLVVKERNITQKIVELYEKRETVTPLQLGKEIHATFREGRKNLKVDLSS